MMTTFLATFMMQLIPEPSDCPLHIVIAQGFFEMNYVNRKDPPSSGIVLNLSNWFSRFYVLGLYDLGWALIRTQAIQFQNYMYVCAVMPFPSFPYLYGAVTIPSWDMLPANVKTQ